MRLSAVQEQILVEVHERKGVRSLLQLTNDLHIDYQYAWWCLLMLDQMGLISVVRDRGKPLLIKPASNLYGVPFQGKAGFGNREMGICHE